MVTSKRGRIIGLFLLAGCAVGGMSVGARGEPTTRPAGFAQEVDGRHLPDNKQTQFFRPSKANDQQGLLLVENLRVHDLTNRRAIDIEVAARGDGATQERIGYGKVIVRNCEIGQVRRDETGQRVGLRVEAMRISGGGEAQPAACDLLIEDVTIRDGNVAPLLIEDGKFNTITLRRVRVANMATEQVQIALLNGGYANQVLIEDCPNLKVQLLGKAGSVDQCVVRQSPGAEVVDVQTAEGRSGAKIVTEAAAVASVRGESDAKAKTGPRLVTKLDAEGRIISVTLEDGPKDAAFVSFSAFDRFDYRMGPPKIVAEGPWSAELKINRTGKVTVQAIITRLGGVPEQPVVTTVEVPKAQ